MPQEAWNQKRERQYEHIKESLEKRGTPEDLSEEIAARTVNKARARAGESRPPAARRSMISRRRGGVVSAPTRGQAAGRIDSSTTKRKRPGSRGARR